MDLQAWQRERTWEQGEKGVTVAGGRGCLGGDSLLRTLS